MKKKRATSSMEAVERSHPHQSRSSTGDFFICFSARPSSSSVAATASSAKRIPSSQALMSPGRGRDRDRDPSSAPALSASLSRRLRSSGSVKGGQSPMFPSGVPLAGRKKGCAFEAAEPSSPKVTCIGQVRVKAKKKVKGTAMVRSRSRAVKRGRECCSGRKQSWVHQLPMSICEALKGIGSELNCFVCCGSGTGEEKGKGEKGAVRSASSSSCGAVVAKWLLAVQENEEEVKGGEKREVGFLVRESEEKVEIEEMGDVGGEKGEILVVGEKGEGGEEAAARVSVCIPPKNALLLMRCRSDPVKMAALANRFWGSPATKPLCEEETAEEEKNEEEEELENQVCKHKEDGEKDLVVKAECDAVEAEINSKKTTEEEENKQLEQKEQLIEEQNDITKEELSCESPDTLHPPPPEAEQKAPNAVQEHQPVYPTEEKTGEIRITEEPKFVNSIAPRSKDRSRRRYKDKDTRRHSFSSELDARRHSFSSEREAKRASISFDRTRRWSFSLEKPSIDTKPISSSAPKPSSQQQQQEEMQTTEEQEIAKTETSEEKKAESGEWAELPDCLLMMMYEPKLSMEVSKETWVCGSDFARCRAQNQRKSAAAKAEPTVVLVQSPIVQHRVLSRPAAVAPYEPVALTRCKSEPVRSSARLAPDACFWKERHRPIGAAGIGF